VSRARVCDHRGVQRAAATGGTDAAPPTVSPALGRAGRAAERVVGWDRFDTAIVVVAAVATVFVHPFHQLMSHPFWLDEAWVAVVSKAPLSQLPRMTATAPIGFVALLRWMPGHGLQRGRLVVLGFSVLTVVMAYVLSRTLGWKRRLTARFAATVTALAVMLMPASLLRNDLKQYTCDAFCALVLLVLAVRAERMKTRSSLLFLGGAAVLAAPFSSTVLFVAVAVFGGLLASAMLDRSWRRARAILVVGLVTGALLAVYIAVAVAPNLSTKVHGYWDNFYLAGSFPHVMYLVWNRLRLLEKYLGMPPAAFVGLFVIGIAVLARLRVRSLAFAMPILWLEMGIIGRLETYPFLDLRTSQFLLVTSMFVVALGAVGIVIAVGQLPFWAGKPVGVVAGALVGGALAVYFAIGFVPHLRDLNIPGEDVRTETQAVANHLRPNDVLVVNQTGNFGFSYYWPHAQIAFHRDHSGQGFATKVVALSNALYVPTRDDVDVRETLSRAVARWKRSGPDSRLFIMRSHVTRQEEKAWQHALGDFGLVDDELVIKAGDPLLVIEKPPVGGS
jgi:hypothetical protein